MGHPYVQFELSTQIAVSEVHRHLHFALRLPAVHKNIVTPVRHLKRKRQKEHEYFVVFNFPDNIKVCVSKYACVNNLYQTQNENVYHRDVSHLLNDKK